MTEHPIRTAPPPPDPVATANRPRSPKAPAAAASAVTGRAWWRWRGGAQPAPTGRPDAQTKARLLYEHCLAADVKMAESVHSLFAVAEHYAGDAPSDLDSPETINGIPPFFAALSDRQKSDFCYNQVTAALAKEAQPVTVASLMATRRSDPSDPSSSVAGRFVRRVTWHVWGTLAILLAVYALYTAQPLLGSDLDGQTPVVRWAIWVGFGCVGALVHLLNHALTTTRLQTFDPNEERKVGPRLLLGGLFGFVLPWMLSASGVIELGSGAAVGSVVAFFAGYSVRFSIGLLERLLDALLPESRPRL